MLILCGLLFSCFITVFINPYGSELPKTWMTIMKSSAIPHVIQEHIPALQAKAGWAILFLGFFYLFSLIGVFPKIPRITWLIPVVWFFMALSRIRHAPLFAVVAVIAVAVLFPWVRWAKLLVKRGSKLLRLSPTTEVPKIRSWALIPPTSNCDILERERQEDLLLPGPRALITVCSLPPKTLIG